MPKKGAVFGFQEIIAAILVIVAFIFVLQFLMQSKTGLDTKLSDFCAKSPESFLCDGKTETITLSDQIASKSTEALACAVNSVSAGKEQSCLSSFPAQKASQETKETDKNTFRPVGIECEVEEIYGSTNSFTLKPDRRVKNCNVQNFNLPQEFGKGTDVGGVELLSAETWAKIYKDPKYLVYWQSFPLEEDTWTSQFHWKFHAALLGLSVLPVGKITASIVGKTAKALPSLAKSVKAASQELKATGKAAEEADDIALFIEKNYGKIQQVAGGKAAQTAKIQELKNLYTGILEAGTSPKINVKRLVGLGTLAGADYVRAAISSALRKYELSAGNIILKMPLENPKLFKIDESWKENPIFLYYTPRFLNSVTTGHLVSPCKIDTLPIVKGTARCEAYIFSRNDGTVNCLEPKKDGSAGKSCKDTTAIARGYTPQAKAFIGGFNDLESKTIPDYMKNYFDGSKVNVFFSRHVKYLLTDSVDFVGDKLLVDTEDGEKEIPIKLIEAGKPEKPADSGAGIAQGEVDYNGAKILVYKYCATWLDSTKAAFSAQVESGEAAQFKCQVGISAKSGCDDAQKDSVCSKLEIIRLEEPYTVVFAYIEDSGDKSDPRVYGTTKFEVNKFSTFEYFKNFYDQDVPSVIKTGENRDAEVEGLKKSLFISKRKLLMGGSKYSISLVDTNFDDVFDSITFYKDGLHQREPKYGEGYLPPSKPSVMLSDSKYSGQFDSKLSLACQIDAIFIDITNAKNKDKYCTKEHGVYWSAAENTLKYGGYTVAAIGVGAAVYFSGGTLGGVFAGLVGGVSGAAIGGGLLAASAGEFSEAMGTWPTS